METQTNTLPESQEPQEGLGVKHRLRKVAMVILPVVLLGGFWMWFQTRNQVSTEDAQVDGHMVSVASRVPGYVNALLVQDNEHVKAGQVLVRLDDQDYRTALDKAKAELAEAEARTAASGSDTAAAQEAFESAQQAEVAVAEANVAARTANRDKARADRDRMKPLAERHEISALSFDAYRTASDVADQELEAAQKRLDAARKDVSIRRNGAQSARSREQATQATIEKARAAVKALELQLSYCTITAPCEGLVTRRTVESGHIIQAGQTLLSLVPLDTVWVTANFKETQLKNVRVGQEATVEVDMNDRVLHGRVDSIAASTGAHLSLFPPENAAGNFVKVVQRVPVKIVVSAQDALDASLRPGLNVTATIHTR
jgi:membrane fusion protein (multidrug efflux system)